MTVKELKKLLENHPNDKKVMILLEGHGYEIYGTKTFAHVEKVVYLESI
jgi:hypothetical protein